MWAQLCRPSRAVAQRGAWGGPDAPTPSTATPTSRPFRTRGCTFSDGWGAPGRGPPVSVGRSGGPPSCLHTLRGPPGPAGSAPATPRSSRVPRGPAPRVEFEVKLSVASCQRLCMLWRQKSCSGFYGPGVGARGQHGASICVCVCARAEAHVCTHVCMRVPPPGPLCWRPHPGWGRAPCRRDSVLWPGRVPGLAKWGLCPPGPQGA